LIGELQKFIKVNVGIFGRILSSIQNRLKCIRCTINETIPQSVKTSQISYFIDMKMLINKSDLFIKEDYQRFGDTVEKFKSGAFLSGYNLIQQQSLSIIDTFKIKSGH